MGVLWKWEVERIKDDYDLKIAIETGTGCPPRGTLSVPACVIERGVKRPHSFALIPGIGSDAVGSGKKSRAPWRLCASNAAECSGSQKQML